MGIPRKSFKDENPNIYRFKNKKMREGEDDGGVGGLGVHLSTQIHQEYALRRRSACRTPAQSQQEYLTSGREYIEPCKTR